MGKKKNSDKAIFAGLLLLALYNIFPLVMVAFSEASLPDVVIFYWAECAILAFIALVIFMRYLVIFFLLAAALGSIVYLANPDFSEYFDISALFCALYGLCWLLYIEAGKSAYGRHIKKLEPAKQLGIYLSVMGIGISVCLAVTLSVLGAWSLLSDIPASHYAVFLSLSVLVPSLAISLIKIIDMIGQKHFLDFLLGRYLHPVEKDSVVMFLDMAQSSAMAEKLESHKSMQLISMFIYDCSLIFRLQGGDILSYTGDGLVVMWPRSRSESAVIAAQRVKRHFESADVKSQYWKRFGIVPEFRIGMHAGPVTLGQIGEEKLFLGLYGDVVNTAARLEQMNKELGTSILMSLAVVSGLNKTWRAAIKPMGEQEVRGRSEKVKVFALYG